MILAIGADHRGFVMKELFKKHTSHEDILFEWLDKGASSPERSDYPIFAQAVARAVQTGAADAGILMCGTGTGMAIAANRFKKVYAAVVWSRAIACASREDDNVNVLVFPSDYITFQESYAIFTTWLGCKFKKDHYAERLALVDSVINE
jgi:ribose 5-phosphate isomerase B